MGSCYLIIDYHGDCNCLISTEFDVELHELRQHMALFRLIETQVTRNLLYSVLSQDGPWFSVHNGKCKNIIQLESFGREIFSSKHSPTYKMNFTGVSTVKRILTLTGNL
jgi:hypothetical protein